MPYMRSESNFDKRYLRLDVANSPLQPLVDSTTALQVLNAAGDTPVFVVDTTNHNIGIGKIPVLALDIYRPSAATYARVATGASGEACGFVVDSFDDHAMFVFVRDGSNKWYLYNNGDSDDELFIGTTTGTPAITILKTQLVGIGPLDPDEKLEVSGNIRTTLDNDKYYAGTTKDSSWTYDGNDMVFNSQEVGTGDFHFMNGKVSVGSITPTARVHIINDDDTAYSSIATDENKELLVNNHADGAVDGTFSSFVLRATSNAATNVSRGTINLINLTSGDNASDMTFQLRNTAGSDNEIIRITSTKRVGINTTDPQESLHVYDPVDTARMKIESDGGASNDHAEIQVDRNDFTAKSRIAFSYRDTEYWGIETLRLNDLSHLNFIEDGTDSRMIIRDGGNVGIGVTDPAAPLEVYTDEPFTTTDVEVLRLSRNAGDVKDTTTGFIGLYLEDDGGRNLQAARLTWGNSVETKGTFTISTTIAGSIDPRIGVDLDGAVFVPDGDLYFIGEGSGLQFAQIYDEDGTSTLALAAQDTFYQITAFSVDGESNGAVPDHTSDYITIDKAGKYLASMSIGFSQTTAVSIEYDFHIQKNGGTVDFPCTSAHRNSGGSSAVGNAASSGILDLANGDTVELWVERLDGAAVTRTITIRQVSLVLTQIGGT